MTKEQKSISYHNHKEAAKFYNLQKGWVLHHIDVNLKDNDIDRYIQWRIEDIVPMTKGDHRRLHMAITVQKGDTAKYGHEYTNEERKAIGDRFKGIPKSEEHKKKISDSNKGKHDNSGEHNPMYGKTHTEGAKKKMSECHKGVRTKGSEGMHWYTNGTSNVLTYNCPEGFYPGRVR